MTVLIVAMELCGDALVRLKLEGRSEQLAYWPELTGVQLRMTVPV